MVGRETGAARGKLHRHGVNMQTHIKAQDSSQILQSNPVKYNVIKINDIAQFMFINLVYCSYRLFIHSVENLSFCINKKHLLVP